MTGGPRLGHNASVRLPTDDDAELMTAIRRYVSTPGGSVRRYLNLLHGNFTGLPDPERTAFRQALIDDAEHVTDRELSTLLDSEWRSRITAAWLIAADRRHTFRERVGELLLASELTYSGQGYCLALARLGTTADAKILTTYLTRYLRRPDCRYDQPWALGALMHLDQQLGSSYAAELIAPNGLWDNWAGDALGPQDQRRRIADLCSELDIDCAPGDSATR